MTGRIRSNWLGEAALAVIAMAAFAIAFSFPVLTHLGRIGVVWDWPEFLIRNWVAFHSLHDLHQIPLWNPYECGGMPLLAHPSSQIVTPLFALPMIFGPFVGLNLQIPIHLAIAWSGGYVLGRVLGMGLMGRLTCASIFPASSWFYLHIGVGHLNFLPTVYLPWVAALVLAGAQSFSLLPWITAGLLLAIMFGEGGVYQVTQAVMLALLIVCWMAIAGRSWRPLLGIAVMFVFAAGFGAIKLLPSWRMMRLHPRPVQDIESSSITILLQGLFTRHQFYDRQRIEAWGFWELGAYLGPAGAALALLGLAGAPRRWFAWFLAALVFFVLALGGVRPWFPWPLLHHLPIFSWERMPERFLILFILAASVMAGLGSDFLARLYKPWGAAAALLLLLAAVADAWMVSRPNMDAPVAGQVATVATSPQFVQDYEDPWSMMNLALASRGALHCNEELDFHEAANTRVIAANQPGYRGEYYLSGPGSLDQVRWTPDELRHDVATRAANVLVINQNYDANWRLVRGRGEVISYGGLLAVRVPSGTQRVWLDYKSNWFRLGAAISLLTCIAAAAVWRREQRIVRGLKSADSLDKLR